MPWHSCLTEPSANSENIRVAGSHTGMPFNPAAVWVVADRLAQPLGHWEPMREPGYWAALLDTDEVPDQPALPSPHRAA